MNERWNEYVDAMNSQTIYEIELHRNENGNNERTN